MDSESPLLEQSSAFSLRNHQIVQQIVKLYQCGVAVYLKSVANYTIV